MLPGRACVSSRRLKKPARWPQDGPRGPQEGPNTAQEDSKMTQERPWTAQDAPQESIKLDEESLRRHPKRPQRTPGRPTAGVGRKPRTVPAHPQSRCKRRLGPEDPAPTNSPARQEKLEIQKTRSWCIRHPGVYFCLLFPGNRGNKYTPHHPGPVLDPQKHSEDEALHEGF